MIYSLYLLGVILALVITILEIYAQDYDCDIFTLECKFFITVLSLFSWITILIIVISDIIDYITQYIDKTNNRSVNEF